MKLEHPLTWMVIRKYGFSSSSFTFANKDIIFCWVPSHIDIRDNDHPDFAAKSALELPRAKVGVPYTDFKHKINQYIVFPHGKIIGMVRSRTGPGRLAVFLQD